MSTSTFDDVRRPDDSVDLARPIRVLRRNAWLPVLLAVLGAAGAWAQATAKADLYAATIVVRVSDPTLGSTLQRDRVDPIRQVDLQVLFAESSEVVSLARSKLGEDERLVREFEARGLSNADALSLRAESTQREVARDAARAHAEAYIETRRDAIAVPLLEQAATLRSDAERLRTEIRSIDDRVAVLSAQSNTTEVPAIRSLLDDRFGLVERANALADRATQLEVEATVRQSELAIVKDAELPGSPTSPKPARDAAVGAVLGLLLGSLLAFPFDRWRDRVWSSDDVVEATLGVQVLAALPTRTRRGRADVAEAYRALRASVLFGASDTPVASILVSGAGAGAGGSTVAPNLAIALAQGGRSVAYVDADLRESRSFFATPSERGLSAYLCGDVDAPALHRVELGLGARSGRLHVVDSGDPVPDLAPNLLTSPRLQALLERLVVDHQHVVIQGPALTSSADSLNVACLVDAVVLVAARGRARRRDLWTSVSSVLQLGAPLKGLVLDGRSRRRNLIDPPVAVATDAHVVTPNATDRA